MCSHERFCVYGEFDMICNISHSCCATRLNVNGNISSVITGTHKGRDENEHEPMGGAGEQILLLGEVLSRPKQKGVLGENIWCVQNM